MWLMVYFIVSVVVFVFLTVWHLHEKVDSQYDFLRREIGDVPVDHRARLANLEMAASCFRERLDALEAFLDIEMKAEPTGHSIDGWKSFRAVYEKIDRCKKCGGKK